MTSHELQSRIKDLEIAFEELASEFLKASATDERRVLIGKSKTILAEFSKLLASRPSFPSENRPPL
jgi:hypothetical protein